ncbi:SagB-type dehydrogenase family enzyme [Nonomuraea polychroma]|uniref:SagB-type dehydrogenase family enzyme n=1 Tax=Nonomuraea polychroma TaxID=46176 RepID=A0A438MIZ2_9ACTN|nr:SagB family peptide dehydrogenase [Nonomuraea polychroma]RVX45516.1 SagB-type dehydrogenase family enzyme [Nonomuraea polychroma]
MSPANTAVHDYVAALRERGPLAVDWSAAPTRHKRYPDAARIPLPHNAKSPSGLGELAAAGELLRELLGIARLIWYHPTDDQGRPAGGPPLLLLGRPAPSGGALYPVEAYLACGDLYHYDPVHHALERVRQGEHTPELTACLACPPAPQPHAVLVLSGVFLRSMFKYGDLGYRLVCQEVGVLAAQALAVGRRLGVEVGVHLRFEDARVERLLGLDGAREGALAVLTLRLPTAPRRHRHLPRGPWERESEPRPRPLPPGPAAALHQAARSDPGSVARRPAVPPLPPGPGLALPDPLPVRLADGVPRRASPPAGYRPEPIPLRSLAAVLAEAARPYPGDGLGTAALYLLAQRVRGLAPGAYRYDAGRHVLHRVGATAVPEAGRLLANTRNALRTAAIALVPVTDPLAGMGARWYRTRQIEAGMAAHRAALTVAALGLTARLHTDGADAADQALGLVGTRWRSLTFLLAGTPRAGGPALARPIHRPPTRGGGAEPS